MSLASFSFKVSKGRDFCAETVQNKEINMM